MVLKLVSNPVTKPECLSRNRAEVEALFAFTNEIEARSAQVRAH